MRKIQFGDSVRRFSSAILATFIFFALSEGRASAQIFIRHTLTNGQYRFVPFRLNDDDLVWDKWPFPVTDPTLKRYAPNLNHRQRIIANTSIATAFIGFNEFDLDETVIGGSHDFVEVSWYDGVPDLSLTGIQTNPWTGAQITSGYNMEWPGMLFRFRSGPTTTDEPIADEGQSTGYNANQIALFGGATGGWAAPMLSPHELVTGILLADQDFVDMRLPHFDHPMNVALWLENPDSWNVNVYARCNAYPNTGVYDVADTTRPSSWSPGGEGAWLDLPVCSGNWFISVINSDPSDRVFHMHFGTHYANREYAAPAERVGIAYNASAADLQAIQDTVQKASWMLYGATDGGHLLRSFEFYNDVNCLSWPQHESACGGGSCRICIQPDRRPAAPCVTSITNMNNRRIWICYDHRNSPGLYLHEFGHAFIGFLDSYATPGNTVCPGNVIGLCGHSAMADQWLDNKNGFCTALNHRTNLVNLSSLSGTSALPPGPHPTNNGPTAYDCDGNAYWTNNGADWSALSGAHVPSTHPPDWSSHNYPFNHFFNRVGATLGAPVP